MKAIKYIFTLILAISVLSCSEDTIDDDGIGTITGTVVTYGSNEPVENAKISTTPASTTVFTDENGEFVLDGIPAGDYSVEAKKEGLLTQFEGASVMAGATVNVIFEMKPETAGNKAPTTPEAVFPEDEADSINVAVDFVWSSSDPENDDLVYQLEIRNDMDEKIFLFKDIADTTFTVEGLDYNNKYFWQVSASDGINPVVLSPLYSFKTIDVPRSRILFTRNIDGNNVIFSRDTEGTEFQLTSEDFNSYRPRKNNSINKIAFLRTQGGKTQLFVMNPNGSQVKQVTSNIPVNGFNLNKIDFTWYNDGAALLYPNFNKLYKVNVAGGGTELIYQTPNGEFITEVDVSKDNQTIALITNNSDGYNANIYTINLNGEVLERVLTNAEGAVGGLDLSLTADALLYSHDVSGYESDDYRRLDSRLFLYKFSDGTRIDLSSGKEEGMNDLDPRFSPNQAKVIFVNTSNDGISQKNIYTLKISGDEDENTSNRNLITENAFMPDWE